MKDKVFYTISKSEIKGLVRRCQPIGEVDQNVDVYLQNKTPIENHDNKKIIVDWIKTLDVDDLYDEENIADNLLSQLTPQQSTSSDRVDKINELKKFFYGLFTHDWEPYWNEGKVNMEIVDKFFDHVTKVISQLSIQSEGKVIAEGEMQESSVKGQFELWVDVFNGKDLVVSLYGEEFEKYDGKKVKLILKECDDD